MQSILRLENISKQYSISSGTLDILSSINLEVETGSTVAIVGPSGSGKTTLLGLCAGLDRPTTGTIHIGDTCLNNLTEDQLAQLRNQQVGFIFQNFQLLPTLTALENIMVPLELQGVKNAQSKAEELIEKVGLSARKNHYPTQLSGGEQQRISLARAFSNTPKILFADEPTGNLDSETSQKIIQLLFDLNKEAGTTLVLVTHDLELAALTQSIIRIKGGKIVS